MRFAVHVVYYANRKRELLRDCLLPLAEEIAALSEVELCHIDRHWRFGPHVRLCVRATDDSARAAVSELALPRIRAYLADHASTETIDEDEYARISERLGTVELVAPPYTPLWQDNSCFIGDYEPRADLLGLPDAVDFYERLQARALGPIRSILQAAEENDGRRLDYVLRIFVVLAASYPSGIFPGQLSYRSHLEDFLFDSDSSGEIRRIFAGRFEAMQSSLVATTKKLISELADLCSITPRRIPYELERLGQKVYRGDDPILRQWSDLFEWGWTEALPLADSGALTEEPGARHLEVAAEISDEAVAKWQVDERDLSPFHTSLRKLDNTDEYVNFLEFSSYRWIVNTVYVLLQLLDVTPKDRYFLQFLVVHAIEAIEGRTWKAHLELALRQYGVVA